MQRHCYGDETLTDSERQLLELADTDPAPNADEATFEAYVRALLRGAPEPLSRPE